MTTKLVKFLFLFSAFSMFFFLETSQKQRLHRVRSMKCSSSNISIASDFKCYAKSYSRTVSTFNINFTFVRPVFEAKVVWICSNLKQFTGILISVELARAASLYYCSILQLCLQLYNGPLRLFERD
jgi:hypothetical protein